MSKILCIYHANCADGLGAAWAVHRALGDNVEFVAAAYGGNHLDIRLKTVGGISYIGRDVIYVDFSDPLPVLRAMAAEARSVLVLDHHKTAQEDLAKIYPPGGTGDDPADWEWWINVREGIGNLAAIFDLNRSGAGLTWDYLHPGKPRPGIIDLIEDRDLWGRGKGPSEEAYEFHAVLASHDWSNLEGMFRRLDSWCRRWVESYVLREGRAILRAEARKLRATVAATRRTIKIAGHLVPCANVPPSMASDAGHLLCEAIVVNPQARTGSISMSEIAIEPPFSATYYDGADGRRHFSLRSPEGGADVGRIAKEIAEKFNAYRQGSRDQRTFAGDHSDYWTGPAFSGGGHAHAAGFDAPLGWEGE